MKYTKLSIFAAMLFMASCAETNVDETSAANTDTAVLLKEEEVTPAEKVAINWDEVDFNSPIVRYGEVTSKEVEVRGNDKYAIYGVNEGVLFATGKADLQPNAKDALTEVCNSISAHNAKSNIRVYGYTDNTGAAADNKDLSAQRAEAVKNYLVANCNLTADRINTVAVGEANPTATNENAKGRQQNRRVSIVAMN